MAQLLVWGDHPEPWPPYQPAYELTRGDVVESIHDAAIAVVDAQGNLLAAHGNPFVFTYLRSSAKPFQALPFIEDGGHKHFGLTPEEIAIICASHSGTDEHVRVVSGIQAKVGLQESQLQCGVHPPYHQPTAVALECRGEAPTPNRHNCSGKHTGMLAQAVFHGWPTENYLDIEHPVQQRILHAFAEMCGLDAEAVHLGTDGCSAPNFSLPLYHAAYAYARLADPRGLPPRRAAALETVFAAMTGNPFMVGGPGRFDTRFMEAAGGTMLSKAGAEAYQGLALKPGVVPGVESGVGIAIKIADGDGKGRAHPAVVLEVLRQLGALDDALAEALADFGPRLTLTNWRKIPVGEGRPCFTLEGEIG
ncbi:MAG TPA: asparaginase [Chloroflexi bacterium]|nr:asparaginase [Chloroflexota bacterium]